MNNLYYYSRLVENATNTGSAKVSGTFKGWQMKAVRARQALMKAREDYDRDLNELRSTYTPNVLSQKKSELDEQYNAILSDAKTKLTDALEDVIASKRRQFDKCSGAPSDENLRLLTALNMRSTLTVDEVAGVVGKLNGNVQSLAVLRDVAAKFNIRVPVGASTPAEFDTLMQRAKEFSLDRLNELDTPNTSITYRGKAFYDYPDHPGEASHFYDPLDMNVLTSEQITTATRQAQAANKAEVTTAAATNPAEDGDAVPMWAEVTCHGASINTIAEQFHVSKQAIIDANPDKSLDRLYTGDKILVPSTRFTFTPGSGHVQPDDVRAVPAVKYEYPTGPNGEQIGEDVSIV